VDTLLTNLDNKQLIQLGELNKIFEVLGNDAEVPRAQAHQMVDDMARQGLLTPQDAAEVKKKLTKDRIRLDEIAKATEPLMVMRPDGTVGVKGVSAPPKSTPPQTGAVKTAQGGFRIPKVRILFFWGGRVCENQVKAY
jgi:hypothetical protein